MILPGVNEVILAHTKLDPGIPVAPMDYLIQHSTEATIIKNSIIFASEILPFNSQSH